MRKLRLREVKYLAQGHTARIFHLIQIKKVRKQDFQKEAQNFRLLTGTHEGHWNIFLAQTPELKVTASPDKMTKTL